MPDSDASNAEALTPADRSVSVQPRLRPADNATNPPGIIDALRAEQFPGAATKAEREPGALLTRRHLRSIFPVSDMTIWRWVKAGIFPAPIKINRRNYWRLREVEAFLAERRPGNG